jgi:MoxR-like ATPase
LPSETSILEIEETLRENNYVAGADVVTAIYLALGLEKPLLIEGEPGCGKTEIAKVLAKGFHTELIRLQCHEGLELNNALYEWDYLRQLIKIKIEEERGKSENAREVESSVYNDRYLLRRPLLAALLHDGPRPPVLLIDEIDRADEEFEAFLLEFLSEYQVTIPEVGTVKAKHTPITILTSNRTRELGDGLRRRCLYLFIDYPTIEKEIQVLSLKVPSINTKLANDIAQFMHELRETREITKKPGIAETLDWASALLLLNIEELAPKTVETTLNSFLKSANDINTLKGGRIEAILSKIREPVAKPKQ